MIENDEDEVESDPFDLGYNDFFEGKNNNPFRKGFQKYKDYKSGQNQARFQKECEEMDQMEVDQ